MKHGMCGTRIYDIWRDMNHRCYCKNLKNYKNYGAVGVMVCDEWRSDFLNFYNWAISNGYSENLTIDRINVYGNYEPSNCRWADRALQGANKKCIGAVNYIGIYLHKNKSCYCAQVKKNKKIIFSYTSQSKNDCAIKRNEFIIKSNLLYPLNEIIEEYEDVRIIKNIVLVNIYDKEGNILYEKIREKDVCRLLNLSKNFIIQCMNGSRNSRKYNFERCA